MCLDGLQTLCFLEKAKGFRYFYEEVCSMNLEDIKNLSLPNYTALLISERLGIDASQEQIDILESLVLMATYPKKVKDKIIKKCIGTDKLAYFFLYLKNKELQDK